MTSHTKKRVSLESLAIALLGIAVQTLRSSTYFVDGSLVLTRTTVEGSLLAVAGLASLAVSKHLENVMVAEDTRSIVQTAIDLVASVVAKRSTVVQTTSDDTTPAPDSTEDGS